MSRDKPGGADPELRHSTQKGEADSCATISTPTGCFGRSGERLHACIALGDWPRAFALVSTWSFKEQLAQMPPELNDRMVSGRAPVHVTEEPRLAEVRDVAIPPDGWVGAVAMVVAVSGQEVRDEPASV